MRLAVAVAAALVTIASSALATEAAAPPINGRIAFVGVQSDYELFMANADGAYERRLIEAPLTSENYPRLAPDGHRLAYSAGGDLSVLDLSTGATRQVTTGAQVDLQPKWAPDGTQLAWTRYQSDGGEIWLANADGTDARRLSPAPAAAQPEWSPDGSRIAYTRGTAVVVVKPNGEDERVYSVPGGASGPRWAPDAKTLVLVRPPPPASLRVPNTIVVLDLSTGQERSVPIAPSSFGPSSADWLADGRIAFWRHNDLFAVAPSGGAVEQLTHTGKIGGDWARLGGRIVYSRDVGGVPQLYDVPATGGERRRLSELEADAPSYSPNGRKIAFVGPPCRHAPFGPCRLYVMPADGGEAEQVAWTQSRPSWSPDGKRLVIETERALAVVSAAGGVPRTIRGTGREDQDPDWSPGGRFIAFTRYQGSLPPEIWRISPQGGRAHLLRRAAESPDWSPDGRSIAFTNPYLPTYYIYVWRMRSDGTHAVRVTRGGSGEDWAPVWSPDGHWIAFVRAGFDDVDRPETERRLLLVDARSGVTRPVVKRDVKSVQVAWRSAPRAR